MSEIQAGPTATPSAPLTRRLIWVEIGLVLALSLGRSGVYALVNLIEVATEPGRLSSSTAVMNQSLAPGREWFDLLYQLLGIGFGLVPVLLAAYLLVRSGVRPAVVWFGAVGRRVSGRLVAADLGRGAIVAAVVGSTGIAFYLFTHALGINLTVVPEALPSAWWKIPILVGWALENAFLEECVVLGFVQLRLRQLGMRLPVAIGLAAVLRGSYHLYQGWGGFTGNLVMGLLFGWLYARWGRVTPLIVAHTLLDVGAFVGYALLAPHVSWLPG
ncbi:MAG: CPBP family intramembrane metalloprotease [Nocardioides sp.]|uniref:CPBP family intramembrane glutamic endopeptidase n=1 Tax=Nocardioides sp. TaxID=35761 RepID=UPI0039E5BF0A